MNQTTTIFNRQRIRHNRTRAVKNFDQYDFLVREAAMLLDERLDDFTRSYDTVLDSSSHTGQLSKLLSKRPDIKTLIQMDISEKMLQHSSGMRVAADEELLPFAESSFDLIMSCCSLHLVNDLPGALVQMQRALKPGGMMLAIFPGGNTLGELRQVIMQAEIERNEGVRPYIAPFIDIKDAGALMQRAKFTMPVVTSDTITVQYPNSIKLMKDLRGMAAANVLYAARKLPLHRSLIASIERIYREKFLTEEKDAITASFELIMVMGIASK